MNPIRSPRIDAKDLKAAAMRQPMAPAPTPTAPTAPAPAVEATRTLEAARTELAAAKLGTTKFPTGSISIADLPQMVLRLPTSFTQALSTDRSALRRLLDQPPALRGEATRFSDGRHIKIAIVLVRDLAGSTVAGIPVQLRTQDGNVLLDHTRTDRRGAAILRFPMKESFEGTLPDAAVHVVGPDLSEVLPVAFTGGAQYALVEAVLPALPEELLGEPGDPYTRIPADFTPELCDEVARILGDWDDPLMENLAVPTDFRSRRTRLIKRFVVPRLGDEKDESGLPKRYLVHLRQEWTFLGYTLGELQGVEALDPGQVVDETLRTVRRTTDTVSRFASNAVQETLATVQDTLSRVSSVDTLVNVATSLHTSTDAGTSIRVGAAGGFIGIPGLFGFGGGAAGASTSAWLRNSVLSNATTRTSTDTSLLVNSMLRSAQSTVNRTVRSAANMLRSLSQDATTATGQVSPLLSRVTNLLRWTVYENYAVCTRVEDVVELKAIRVIDETPPGRLFSAEDIVEYAPYFQDRLLDPALGGRFVALRRAVEMRQAATRPVTGIRFTVEHACQWAGADLRIRVGGEDVVVELRPGGRSASAFLHLPRPVGEDELGAAALELSLRTDRVRIPDLPFNFDEALRERARAEVTRIRMEYVKGPGVHLPDADSLEGFVATVAAPVARTEVTLRVPPPHVFPESDPLYLHVNRNPRHYMGLLLQAALEIPSLRDDCRQIRELFGDPTSRAVWRLPIAGFEGDHILVVGDVAPSDAFAQRLAKDIGAGTLVQIAAPGAYSEALQGLLQLADAAGKIHPALIPLPPPQVPPIALVDLQGRAVQLIESATNGTTPAAPTDGGLTTLLPRTP